MDKTTLHTGSMRQNPRNTSIYDFFKLSLLECHFVLDPPHSFNLNLNYNYIIQPNERISKCRYPTWRSCHNHRAPPNRRSWTKMPQDRLHIKNHIIHFSNLSLFAIELL